MKLFQRLLVAPAALGLLAPFSASANEVNLNEISNYSNSESIDLANSFNNDERTESPLLAGGEGLVDTPADSFSSTTTASFGTTFYVGSINEGADDGITTFTYDYSMDLSTSFTGEDSLDVAIIGGNADGDNIAVDGVMGGDMAGLAGTVEIEGFGEADLEFGTPDYLVLDGISYTFPLGGFTVIAGDGVGVDDLNTGACAYSAFTDTISDCGTSNVGGEADSAVAASYDFGNGFTVAGGVGFATEDTGMLSDEDASTIGLEAAYTADTYGISVAFTDDETVTYWTVNAMLAPEGYPSLSVGYETDDSDSDAIFAGLTFDEVGPGSVSVGIASTATDTNDLYQYELSYSYPVNDGMTITPGVFISEQLDDEDDTGFVVKTSFSF